MLIDCVFFGGELEMLKGRLATLGKHVDKFIIVEGEYQFQNQHKGFILEQNKEFISGYEEKIIYYKPESLLSNDPWANEKHQRRAFEDVLNGLNLSGNDLVTICDVDEWWSINDINNTKKVSTMNSKKFNMSLHWFHKREQTGVISQWDFIKGKDVDEVRRHQRHTFPEVFDSFHYTSMGSYEYLLNKMKGYAHSEFNVEGIDEQLYDQWANGHFYGERFVEVDFDETTPKWVSEHRFPKEWYKKIN